MIEQKALLKEIASTYGTPCYVYDGAQIKANFQAYQQAFAGHSHEICYAVKANSNIQVLSLLAELGAGFDVVSIGELYRVIKAGGNPRKVIFSGVAKTRAELKEALTIGIEAFDIESLPELELLIEVAASLKTKAPVSFRFNPDVDAKTHPYISTGLKDNKFGLTEENAYQAYLRANISEWIEIVGINMHIGSQLTELSSLRDAIERQKQFVERLRADGIMVKHINFGGGLGIRYQDEKTIPIDDWVGVIAAAYPNDDVKLVVEPGRSIVGAAGVLLTEVIYLKEQNGNRFAIVDAGMNDYMRVALYQAHANFINLNEHESASQSYQVVGPVCESTDCFTKNANLSVQPGDILALTEVGAYGFAMASTYNTRGKPAEVMIDETGGYRLIRRRETFEEMIVAEMGL